MYRNGGFYPAIFLINEGVIMVALKDTKDFGNNPYLYLMLGPACNMCCRHCSQIPYKPHVRFIDDNISEDMLSLLDNYIQYYQNKTGVFKKAFISFWGGEALLHWNLIKKIVPYFTEKYNMIKNDNVTFLVASNGLLLTDEMVDFFNQYRVQFDFSYDAPYPFAVRGYVSEEIIDRVKKIKRLCVLSSMNALNCDLYAGLRCLKEKFGQNVYKIFFNFQLLYTFVMANDISSFDFEKVRKGIKMCRIAIQMGHMEYGRALFPLVKNIMEPDVESNMVRYNMRHCVPATRYLCVTLDGKVVRCHNDDSDVVGTIYDSLSTIFKNGLEMCFEKQGYNQTEKCRVCEHRDICPGGCFASVRDENNCYQSCDMYVKPIFSILKEEVLRLSEPLTEADKDWYESNLPEYNELVSNYVKGKYDFIKTK